MGIVSKLAARNLAAHPSRYALAVTSVGLGVAFMVTAQLVTQALSAQYGDAREVLVLLGMFGVIVLVASAFVIANSFAAMITARTTELAVLRAVGAHTGQLHRNVLLEGLALGAAGAALGLVLGTAGAWSIEHFAMGVPLTLPGPATIALALTIGIGTDLVAVVLPARRAARTSPMAALTTADLGDTEPVARARTLFGSLVSVLGLAIAMLPVAPTATIVTFISGGMILFAGLAMLAPRAVPGLAGALGAITGRLAGHRPVLVMAARNLVRSPRRVANAAVSVALGVTLFTGMVAVGNSLVASVPQVGPDEMAAIYRVTIALTGLTLAVGIVGVVNTISMGIRERARELGLLRATGMTAGQLRATLLAEGVFIAALGIAGGLALGVTGSALLVARMGVGLVVPVAGLAVLVAATLLLVLVVTAVPVARAARPAVA